ncbi:MAG: PAS domain-containing protein, partial [Bacteroidota bacterium]
MNDSSTLYENGSKQSKASDKQKKLEGRLWMDSTLSKFDDILRINYDKTIEAFCDIIIAETCEIVGAISGSFFILDQHSEQLKASAGYGCTVETMIKDEFKIGEGIVGQVAKSKKIRYIEEVPPHSVLINSGLGKISACSLICLPLLFNEQVHGVIELISLTPFETRYQDLLARLSKNLASTLQSIQNNVKMRTLLEQLQQESQKKSAQEEELRQNMEEMAATQEQMRRQQDELQRLKDDLIEKAKELETTVQRFELAADTTTEGLWDLKIPENQVLKDDTFFWWSDNFRRMLGFENQEDFPDRLDSWTNLLHPDHTETTLAAFDAHLFDYSGKTPYDIEYQLQQKDGSYRWFRAVGKTLRDARGKPIRVAGTLIDIQDQKDLAELQWNLEQKIREQTKELATTVQRFELAADTTTEGLWDLEIPENQQLADDTFFWWSEKFRRMLGYENESDFPNRLDSWSNLLHPDHKDMTLAAFEAHLFDYSGHTPYDVEYQLLRKN